MASYVKLKKNPTIVGAQQVVAASAGNYGTLGTLESSDWILYLADGTLATISSTEKDNNWSVVNNSADLTGSDVT